jgi:hypothetical protein
MEVYDMVRNLNTSFGSEPVLRQIQKKNSSRQMTLLTNSSEETSFQLVDFSDQENIFYSPNRYQVLSESTFSVTGNIFIYDFFELADDTLSAFDEKIHHWSESNAKSYTLQNVLLLRPVDSKPHNRAILTIWNSESNHSTFEMRELKELLEPYMNHNYFRTTYEVLT